MKVSLTIKYDDLAFDNYPSLDGYITVNFDGDRNKFYTSVNSIDNLKNIKNDYLKSKLENRVRKLIENFIKIGD